MTADFVVSLDRTTSGVVELAYTTNQLTGSSRATAGSDYEERSGTLLFQPGETTKTVSVPVLDDAVAEGTEFFELQLTSVKRATLSDASGTGTITNAAPLTISISDATATEGVDEIIDFTVSLNRATNRRLQIGVLILLRNG